MFRALYVSNAFEESEKRARGVTGDSPAASGKVIALCNAVRRRGGRPYVVSMGRQRVRGSWKWYSPSVRRAGRVPVVYAAYLDAPVLTHAVSALSLLVLCLRIARRRSAWVFYNFLPHYLPTLAAGRLLGNRCILDLEDGVRSDDRALKSRIGGALLRIHRVLCDRVMVASSALACQVPDRPVLVCHGVAPSAPVRERWEGAELKVLFGGALLGDTGVELFLAATEIVARDPRASRLKFVVTGFGSSSGRIREAAGAHGSRIDFRGTVSTQEYAALLVECHIGLCLKMPSTSMGATTFPSKVVELAGHGLLVVSTRVSDVPALLPNGCAILLDEPTPRHLADALLCAVDAPAQHGQTAARGQARIVHELSAARVGAALVRFWDPCDAPVPEAVR